MRYFVTSNDERKRSRWKTELEERGFEIAEEYDSETIIVTLGGDGTILYAARTYADPTILPVRTGDSKGYKTQLETEQLLDVLEQIETGRSGDTYTVHEQRKLTAYRDGVELQGGFEALNEISLHHSSPILAAELAVRIRDRDETSEFEQIIGDGIVVATPFGSMGYYRSITSWTFSDGIGVAFNNVHTPIETPRYMLLSDEAVVEVEMMNSEHSSNTVLTRDNHEKMYELAVEETIEIRQSDESIEILHPLLSEK